MFSRMIKFPAIQFRNLLPELIFFTTVDRIAFGRLRKHFFRFCCFFR